MIRFVSFFLFFFMSTITMAAPPRYIHVHPDKDRIDVECPPEGGTVTTTYRDERGELVNHQFECEPADTKSQVTRDSFRWALGTQGFYLSVDEGPSGGGVDTFFEGRLRMSKDFWFVVNTGPGVAWLGDYDPAPSISTLVGVEWQQVFGGAFDLLLGARHRVVFDGSSDLVSMLTGEGRIVWNITDSFGLHFGGGVGMSWFPTMGPQPGNFPVGSERPIIAMRGDGFAWAMNFGLSYGFD
jgi:hypothetical protein